MTGDDVTRPADVESTLTEELVQRCYAIDFDTISERAVERTTTLFVDFLGVLLGGVHTDSGHVLRDYASAVYGGGPVTIAGSTEGAPAPVAALANATMAHSIELDDTHSGGSVHPGAVIFPTALALAERENLTGETFVEGVVAGYELLCRVARAADPPELYARGYQPTAVCGVFGAALTAAYLLDLDEDEATHAVGIAGSFAAGNLAYVGSMSKHVQPGVAAHAGVTAAELATRGYTGSNTILEGDNGFLQGYSGRPKPARLLSEIDDERDFEITRTGIKPHACCRYNQTPIDAALALSRERRIDPDDIERVLVEVVETALEVAEPRAEKIRPETTSDAQFSPYFGVAVALYEGRAFLEQHREPYLSDERILDLAERIRIEHAPAFDEHYPDYWPARVTMVMEDGAEYTAELKTGRGEPENPLPEQVFGEKFRTLAGRELDEDSVAELESVARRVPMLDDLGVVTAYL